MIENIFFFYSIEIADKNENLKTENIHPDHNSLDKEENKRGRNYLAFALNVFKNKLFFVVKKIAIFTYF